MLTIDFRKITPEVTVADLKEKWRIAKMKGQFIKEKKMVDVCIPAYREEGYIEYTIDKLMNQTLWKEGLMNIVVGEYSYLQDHLKGRKSSYLKELCTKNGVIHVFVPQKGIGFARNYTILNGSISDIICNLDADARFSSKDAVQKLLDPILEGSGKIVSTYCDTIIVPDDDLTRKQSFEEIMFRRIYNNIGILEKSSPFGRAPGLVFKREVFYRVNGFPIVNSLEDYSMNWRISMMYGILSRKFVSTVKVLASDRRAKALSKEGALDVLNYNKDYR